LMPMPCDHFNSWSCRGSLACASLASLAAAAGGYKMARFAALRLAWYTVRLTRLQSVKKVCRFRRAYVPCVAHFRVCA
jgi:hypothetical protein